MKTINIPDFVATGWNHEVNAEKNCWISIGEENQPHVENQFLDRVDNLKIRFYDLEADEGEFPAPTAADAQKIVDFILANPGKNVIVNCAAGISRSAAVCKFLEDLGYEWVMLGKKWALPNELVYQLLSNARFFQKAVDFYKI